jgi:alpha 1,4-glycosyltransferase/glycosyl transferase-like sugar-binding protein
VADLSLRAVTEAPAKVLPVIQMFWHGAPLSRVEQLSLASFVHHGHPVHLYSYEPIEGVPMGVTLRDAREILAQDLLFRHRRTQSLAPFADWFRYRLLYERGGIWADADVVCLNPFDYAQPRVFGWQDEELINNAVIGLPAGDPLAKWMADSCEHPNRWLPYDDFAVRLRKLRRLVLRGNRRGHIRWGENGPIGLTTAIRHFGYLDQALPVTDFYPVPHERFRVLFESPGTSGGVQLEGSRAVHLWNNMLEHGAMRKNARFAADSPFEQLCARYL